MLGLFIAAIVVAVASAVYGFSQPGPSGQSAVAWVTTLAGISVAAASALAMWQSRSERRRPSSAPATSRRHRGLRWPRARAG